ncbi:MAG: arginine--tRNA ligase [Firmicutes bacterium]|nr:arginine--tRNA ligase [Candidatus Alectryobacillus merdavium]
MKLEDKIKNLLLEILSNLNIEANINDIEVVSTKDKQHGDLTSNVALKFSKKSGKNPRDFANSIISSLNCDEISKVEIAGPGFINIFLKQDALSDVIDKVLKEGSNFGQQEEKDIVYNIEYVSANPTGDLHLGHARGAALGDSLSRIFKKAGYKVIREFYVNDAGAQVTNLAKSLKSRYLELFNISYPIPEDGYLGEDVKEIAKLIKEEYGDKYKKTSDEEDIQFFKEYGIEKELEKLKKDLKEFRVEFDKYSFETKIRENNSVEHLIEKMKDYVYVSDGATFLKTSDFLDDKDRPIIKSNGDYTYFLPDIVYHLDKLSRNADFLIDILGADHHGYINRMKSALMMNGYSKDALEVELIQMVRLIKNGEEVKMSKRLGNAIKMRDLVNTVGVDACRYFFVNRAASQHLDFDLDIALASNSSNPVYYSQYAFARISSLLLNSKIELNNKYDLLINDNELELMKILNNYDKIIVDAFNERAPYKICNYLYNFASKIHEYYSKVRILDENNKELSGARLTLLKACSIVLKDALSLIGVNAPEKM